MTVVIKNKDTDKVISDKLSKLKSKKQFNAKKHCGVIKLKEDALTLQKKWRNEWK